MSVYSIQARHNTSKREKQRLTLTLLLALAIHALLILGINFDVLPHSLPNPVLSFNVAFIEKPGGKPDTSPDQETPVAEPPQPVSPASPEEPLGDAAQAASQVAVPVAKATPTQQSTLSAKVRVPIPIRKTDPLPKPELNKPTATAVSASELRNRVLQMARLEIASRSQIGETREKYINPDSMTTLENFYLQNWKRKVERVGTLNFPEQAKQLSVPRGPTLDVALRADGTVHSIRLVHSSGYQSLDRAAFKIVELAAPYAPFPKELQSRYDILHIVRKWRFEQGQLLGP